ncbi:extracellular solute-binding protein [Nocardioides sp.]|uniref:ABC transporter substrate-binding protein n=1 Tax=Nocardioides sp. TaxID=35761 RepID=UPI001A1F9813|nr:extracellular solute-binding protein [Nocardioides sp.]MBJ7356686.1 extracellular solute-binding protein [Nocardioides sp.]
MATRLLGAMLTACLALTACTGSDDPDPEPTSAPPPIVVVDLEFGVWGTDEEVAAYRDVVEVYDQETDEVNVEVTTYATHRALIDAIEQGDVPDVFLADRGDLATLLEEGITQPIGERLDERDVDFGDDYSRAALEAFSFDRDLQCMPYGISPLVVYYNTALVDFERMAERGLEVPNLNDEARLRWSLEELRVAAEFATRPRRGTSGLYVPPTLDGLSPFVLSGGGRIFNDDDQPTSLDFSSDDSRSALEQALPVLRDPRLTLTPDQLARRTAATWFERGKLGMIVGDRSLTAEFRRVPGLEFGVMPMPIIDDAATVGGLTGICIAADTPDLAESADLLVDIISTESVQRVVPAGYLVPANQTVALTDDFLQPTRQPARADVFNDSVRDLYVPPLLDDEAALEEAVEPGIELLLNVEIPDIEALTTQIDEASQAVLSPPDDPTDEPVEPESSDD